MRRRLIALGCGLALGIAALTAANVPRRAPEYVVKLPTGKQLLLSQYRGKAVALMFVLTTCPHCQHTCQLVERLKQEYGSKGFQPLAVAFNDNAERLVGDFVGRLGLTFPVGYDDRERVYTFLERPMNQRTFVPLVVFIDRKGTIRAQYTGEDKFFENANQEKNFRMEIEKLLGASSAASKARTRKKSS